MKPSCQTLSKALEMSRKTPLTSAVGLLSKAVYISCIIDSNWTIHESPGRKPGWDGVKSLLLRKWLNKELQITLSNILPKIWSKPERW